MIKALGKEKSASPSTCSVNRNPTALFGMKEFFPYPLHQFYSKTDGYDKQTKKQNEINSFYYPDHTALIVKTFIRRPLFIAAIKRLFLF